ncbi:MAG: NYN domain-containing protein [Candidatus Paceibacterota bacterium]|jgi:uncharacterized LabA/DUF88 family protein
MFTPKTDRIKEIAEKYPEIIEKLVGIFSGRVNVYIDYANVRPWSEKLQWHIEPRRLKQFLQSFGNISLVRFYQGELVSDPRSHKEVKHLQSLECKRFSLRTKPVKIMKFSIDMSSVDDQSPILLRHFIRASLLRKLDIETIEFLNKKLREMNKKGAFEIQDRKCNFDVEIGSDMRVDHLTDGVETFVLWSGDSDFADPIKSLLENKKKVVLFATAGRISRELNDLIPQGLIIFDIGDIQDFICWLPEIERKKTL